MKKLFGMILLLLAMGCVRVVTSCTSHNTGAAAETSVAERAEDSTENGSSSFMDTLLMVDGKALGFRYMGYHRTVVAYDLQPIMDDPTASFDSISPTLYVVDLVGRRLKINICNASCVEKIKAFDQPLRGFRRYYRKFEMASDSLDPRHYFFTLDFPEGSQTAHDEISKWLVTQTCCAHYKGNPTDLDKLSEYASKAWKASLMESHDWNDPCTFFFRADYRARVCNERFVTYCSYEYSYCGGAHGSYATNLVSYDLINHRPIDNDYLFRAGTTAEVKTLLLDAIAQNEKYRLWNEGVKTLEDVKKRIAAWNNVETFDEADAFYLPQAGLTDEGLLFSFQPYDIGCFAEGFYHILIPYTKVKPYLSKQVVRMLGI